MSILKRIWQRLKPGPRVVSKEEMGRSINEFQERYGLAEEELPEMFQDYGFNTCRTCRYSIVNNGHADCLASDNRLQAVELRKKGQIGECRAWKSLTPEPEEFIKLCNSCNGVVYYYSQKVATLCTNPNCENYMSKLFSYDMKNEEGCYIYGPKDKK